MRVFVVALVLLLTVGCARGLEYPPCNPGVKWHAEGEARGAHAAPMHSGSAIAGFTADCDGGPGPGMNDELRMLADLIDQTKDAEKKAVLRIIYREWSGRAHEIIEDNISDPFGSHWYDGKSWRDGLPPPPQ